MKKLLHKISHIFGLNTGTIESFTIGSSLYIGFKCSKCGEINHAHIADYIFSYKIQDVNNPENTAQWEKDLAIIIASSVRLGIYEPIIQEVKNIIYEVEQSAYKKAKGEVMEGWKDSNARCYDDGYKRGKSEVIKDIWDKHFCIMSCTCPRFIIEYAKSQGLTNSNT